MSKRECSRESERTENSTEDVAKTPHIGLRMACAHLTGHNRNCSMMTTRGLRLPAPGRYCSRSSTRVGCSVLVEPRPMSSCARANLSSFTSAAPHEFLLSRCGRTSSVFAWRHREHPATRWRSRPELRGSVPGDGRYRTVSHVSNAR